MYKFEGLYKLAFVLPSMQGVKNFGNGVANVAHGLEAFGADPNKTIGNLTQSATSGLLNSGENWLSGMADKFAPLLTLPIAYGLLSGNNQSNQPATNQPVQGYGAPIQSHPIIPQYFGQDKVAVATPALILQSLHRKAVNSAIDHVTKNNSSSNNDIIVENNPAVHITAENKKTEKLLKHPAVNEYINSLINE